MRNPKVFHLPFLVIICFLLFVSPIFAANFSAEYDITYDVSEDGVTHVTSKITLISHTSQFYPSDYTLTTETGGLYNIRASDPLGPLEVRSYRQEKNTVITVTFNKKLIGEGNQLTWSLTYDSEDLARKEGRLWQVRIPRVEKSVPRTKSSLTLQVPLKMGPLENFYPEPSEAFINERNYIYKFEGEKGEQALSEGVFAEIGDYQLFHFRLWYHLENPISEPAITEIALLPEFSSNQRIFIKKLYPEPLEINKDQDGNFLARYRLSPQSKLDVLFEGQAKVSYHQIDWEKSGTSNQIPQDLHAQYTRPAKFWPTNDPKVQEIVSEFNVEEATVAEIGEKIYHFVLDKLDYNQSKSAEEIKRLGATDALENPDQAVCMEFTDLFITLLRVAGIPARELDGYAYSKDLATYPSGDVLHSWVQFFDPNLGWITVDPTWGETAGIDYFHKFDMNHLAFVVKGLDSEKPYPAGSYKTEVEEEACDIDVRLVGKREVGTLPFLLWKQNWERAREVVDLLDLFFRWLVRLQQR